MEWGTAGFKDVAINNFYYYVSQMIQDNGPTTALIFLGLFLALMTLFKTSCYFASSAVMIPLRTEETAKPTLIALFDEFLENAFERNSCSL